MAKPPRTKADEETPRSMRARPAGELVADISGIAFKKFGFVQGAVVSRWAEIVGERYANVSTPEAIRFPAGRKSGGTLQLLVEGAHAPLMQHLGPMIVERVNAFFGYEAIGAVAFRQGRARVEKVPITRIPDAAIPKEMGENLRQVADPELRAVLESLAGKVAASTGAPVVETSKPWFPPLKGLPTIC